MSGEGFREGHLKTESFPVQREGLGSGVEGDEEACLKRRVGSGAPGARWRMEVRLQEGGRDLMTRTHSEGWPLGS